MIARCTQRICALLAVLLLIAGPQRDASATNLQSGLVGYWPLNEGAGTVANDMATGGVADNGDIRNAPAWINGKFNAGLQFTGSEDVLIGPSADMDIGTSAVTLSAWVKLDKLPGDLSLPDFAGIYDSSPAATADAYVMYLDRGNAELRFKVTDNAGVTTGAHPGIPASMLNTTDWHHVMGVYDGDRGSVEIFLNGNRVDIGSIPTNVKTVRSGQTASIGAEAGSTSPFTATRWFQGGIADVAVWNRALGGAEAQHLYNSGTGNAVGAGNPDIAPLPPIGPTTPSAQPVIHYRFDGNLLNHGTGGAALNAVFHDGPDASGPQFAGATIGQGLDLRANPSPVNSTATNGDYVSADYMLPDKGTITLNFQDMTWFNFNTLWSNSVHNNAWEAWIYGDGRLAARTNDGSGNNNLDFHLPLVGDEATPHHVALTWERSGTQMSSKIYVDGELREQYVETYKAPGNTLFVGGGFASNGANHLGRGIYDDFRVYDVALSESEILSLARIPEPSSLIVAGLGIVFAVVNFRRSKPSRN